MNAATSNFRRTLKCVPVGRRYISFLTLSAQVAKTVKLIASGLIELGVTSEHRLNIYSGTRANWQLVAHGALCT
jgi:long-subunit acyl-CoA synthetase (AMP-forming)